MIYTKEALIKAKDENSDHVVTRNTSHFFRIPKDTFFPNSTSDESDGDFEYSGHGNNDNDNHSIRHYILQPLCWYGSAFERSKFGSIK